MPEPVKVLLLVLGGCVLILVAAGAAGWHWLSSNRERFEAAGKIAKAEGATYGRGHAATECVLEALRRGDACDGFVCEAKARTFLKACAEAAPAAPELCEGVPLRDEIIASALWALERCRQSPHPDVQRCGRIFTSLQEHCGTHRAPALPQAKQPESAGTDAKR